MSRLLILSIVCAFGVSTTVQAQAPVWNGSDGSKTRPVFNQVNKNPKSYQSSLQINRDRTSPVASDATSSAKVKMQEAQAELQSINGSINNASQKHLQDLQKQASKAKGVVADLSPSGLKSLVGLIGGGLGGLFTKLTSGFQSKIKNMVQGKINSLKDKAISAVKDATIGKVQGAIGSVVNGIGNKINAVTGAITNAAGQVVGTIDKASGIITDPSGQVIGFVDQATGQIIDQAGNAVGNVASMAVDTAVAGATSAVTGVGLAAIGGTVNAFTGTITSKGGKVLGKIDKNGLVKNTQGQVIAAVNPTTGNIVDNAGNVIGSAPATFGGKSGPNSPGVIGSGNVVQKPIVNSGAFTGTSKTVGGASSLVNSSGGSGAGQVSPKLIYNPVKKNPSSHLFNAP